MIGHSTAGGDDAHIASSTTVLLAGCETRYWRTTAGAGPATLMTAANRPGSAVVTEGDAHGAPS